MSVSRSSSRVSVVLPPPDRPTRPIFAPLGTARSRPSKSGFPPPWAKVTCSKRTSAAWDSNGSGDAGSSTVGGVSSSSVNCAASVIELSRRR